MHTHYLIFRCFFLPKKTPEGTAPASTRGLEASNHLVWSHPITLRSLVVEHTAWTQNGSNFDTFDTFSQVFKNTVCFKKFHINDLELSFSATFAESRCASFPCSQQNMIFGGWGGVGGPSFRPVLPSARSARSVLPPGPSFRPVRPSARSVLPPGPSARSVRPPGPSARTL